MEENFGKNESNKCWVSKSRFSATLACSQQRVNGPPVNGGAKMVTIIHQAPSSKSDPFFLFREPFFGLGQHSPRSSGMTSNQLCPS